MHSVARHDRIKENGKREKMKLLYIDACIRDEASRTKKIASALMEDLMRKYETESLTINDLPLEIVRKESIAKRLNGDIPEVVIAWANKIREADRIVVSAPFWDMSIPAALKVFIELCSILNITFKDNGKTCYGNCNCEKVLFVTTRGMDISTGDPLDQATSYLKALSWLWGLGSLSVVSAQNMDYVSEEEIERKIDQAIREGLEICKDF